MIAAPFDRRAAVRPPAPAPWPAPRGAAIGRALEPGRDAGLALAVVPLLVRLLAGEPLDRDQRGVLVGEVLRLWAIEEAVAERRAPAAVTAPRAPSR